MSKGLYMAYVYTERSEDADLVCAFDGVASYDRLSKMIEAAMIEKGARYAEVWYYNPDHGETPYSQFFYDTDSPFPEVYSSRVDFQ